MPETASDSEFNAQIPVEDTVEQTQELVNPESKLARTKAQLAYINFRDVNHNEGVPPTTDNTDPEPNRADQKTSKDYFLTSNEDRLKIPTPEGDNPLSPDGHPFPQDDKP